MIYAVLKSAKSARVSSNFSKKAAPKDCCMALAVGLERECEAEAVGTGGQFEFRTEGLRLVAIHIIHLM